MSSQSSDTQATDAVPTRRDALRVLIVESRVDRAIRIAQALRPCGSVRSQRVADRDELLRSLNAGLWNAVLVGVDSFDDASAWLACHDEVESAPPCIIVSANDDARGGLRLLREGAAGVVLSSEFDRLAEHVLAATEADRSRAHSTRRCDRQEEQEHLMKLVLDVAQCSQFTWALANDRIEFRPSLGKVFGSATLDAYTRPTDFLSAVNEQDHDVLLRSLRRCLDGGAEEFGARIRVAGDDGIEHLVHIRGRAFADEDGRVVRLSGAVAPIQVSKPQRRRSSPNRRATSTRPSGPRRQVSRILLVEDEDLLRRMADMLLKDLGYHVTSVESAEAALECFRSDDPPDLLITDVMLPGRTGPQLVAELRVKMPGLRVIYTSGYGDQAISERGLDAERVNLLPKPYTTSELAARVRGALGQSVDERAA